MANEINDVVKEFNKNIVKGIDRRNRVFSDFEKTKMQLQRIAFTLEPHTKDIDLCMELSEKTLDDFSLFAHKYKKSIGTLLFSVSNFLADRLSSIAENMIFVGNNKKAIDLYKFIGTLYTIASEKSGFSVDKFTRIAIKQPSLFWFMKADHTRLSKPKKNASAYLLGRSDGKTSLPSDSKKYQQGKMSEKEISYFSSKTETLREAVKIDRILTETLTEREFIVSAYDTKRDYEIKNERKRHLSSIDINDLKFTISKRAKSLDNIRILRKEPKKQLLDVY